MVDYLFCYGESLQRMPVRNSLGLERLRMESPRTTGNRPGLDGSTGSVDADAILGVRRDECAILGVISC